jgi:putative transposase
MSALQCHATAGETPRSFTGRRGLHREDVRRHRPNRASLLAIYRKNPDIVALLPKARGQRVGTRRLSPDTERLLNDVIDFWAAKAEHLPVAWILEECKRRTQTARLSMPSRRAIDARLRDRGLDGLSRRHFVPKADAAVVLTPRSRKALAIVQMDHTLVDIMVVDEVLR